MRNRKPFRLGLAAKNVRHLIIDHIKGMIGSGHVDIVAVCVAGNHRESVTEFLLTHALQHFGQRIVVHDGDDAQFHDVAPIVSENGYCLQVVAFQ